MKPHNAIRSVCAAVDTCRIISFPASCFFCCFFAFWNKFIFRDVDLETIRKERKSLSRSHKQCATSAIAKSKDVLFHKQSTKNNNRREKKRAERFAMGWDLLKEHFLILIVETEWCEFFSCMGDATFSWVMQISVRCLIWSFKHEIFQKG